MNKLTPVLKHSLLLVCSLVLSLNSATTASALTNADLDRFDLNGIYYYNPMGFSTVCIPGPTASFNGADVFSDAQWNAIQQNKSIYEAAAKQYGIPWEILAVIHSIESGVSDTNPTVGDGGVFGLTDYGHNHPGAFPRGEKADLKKQSEIAAGILSNIAKSNNIDLNSSNGIKRLFFIFNGAAERYIQKALELGFTEEQAKNGEGSPYVMNRYDSLRDPNINPDWKGYYTGPDSFDENGTFNWFGAYPRYQALGGQVSGEECYDAGIIPGGATSDTDALSLIEEFIRTNCKDLAPYGISCDPNSVYRKENCVSFVRYFLNRYTDLKVGNDPLGDGKDVARNLANRFGLPLGKEPRPYAIFSTVTGDGYGHTGVVLGIQGDTIYIGQESYYDDVAFARRNYKYSLSEWKKKYPNIIYVYLDGHVYGDKIRL